MDQIIRPYLRNFVIVFLSEDILIYSSTIESHLQQITQGFNSLAIATFYLKFSKAFSFELQLNI